LSVVLSERKIWNPEWECADRETIHRQQLLRLQATVAYTYERVAPYRAKMDAKGVKPSDIQCLEDIWLLPFTTKKDFHDAYPFGLFAVPPRN